MSPLELAEAIKEVCDDALSDGVDQREIAAALRLAAERVEEWEPSEAQQGLIPIPDGYAEP